MPKMRRPNPQEMRILKDLLSYPFTGHEGILKQLETCLVTEFDANGSLEFQVADDLRVPDVAARVPVEAEYFDVDNVMCHILIHIVDGKIDELEQYKENLEPIVTKYPDTNSLDIFGC